MSIILKASDLKYKYPRNTVKRSQPKFSGLPDPAPFDRDDLYEILPLMGGVMDELETRDGVILHNLEDLMNQMPRFIATREEVFDSLQGSAREYLKR
jgi:hypothetical protein